MRKSILIFEQFEPGHHHPVDFIRAIGQSQGSGIGQGFLYTNKYS